jgi:hypothetical protein
MTTRTKPTNNTAVLRQINTDEWQQMGIRQLLADLCYIPESDPKKDRPHNRLAEMGEYRIAPEMLDLTGMGGEAGFLRAVESLLEQKIAPTFDSVEKTLAYIVNSPEQAHEIVERVRAHRTRTGDIRANAFATAEHLKIGYAAWLFHSVAETEFMGTLGNYEQRFMRAMERIQSIAPVTRRTAATSYDALWEMFREYAREAKKRRDEGKAVSRKAICTYGLPPRRWVRPHWRAPLVGISPLPSLSLWWCSCTSKPTNSHWRSVKPALNSGFNPVIFGKD